MTILVAGGAGYIGSHFVNMLAEQGRRVVVLDDLSEGHRDAVPDQVPLVQAQIGDRAAVADTLRAHQVSEVVDFAGLIQVGESVQKPDRYYATNVVQTIAFLDELVRAKVHSFVFSSTAAVYGTPDQVPILETMPTRPINPYGATKLVVELAAQDYARAFGLRVACLRYFNAAGAHASGRLRERHRPETHLIPLAIDAGLGLRPPLSVFGNDWNTPDGTCVRDYIHVDDLAEAHLLALDYLQKQSEPLICNLGTGCGWSVMQVIQEVGRALGKPVPFTMGPRRDGDPESLVASGERARQLLGWRPTRSDLPRIVEDAVRSRTLP